MLVAKPKVLTDLNELNSCGLVVMANGKPWRASYCLILDKPARKDNLLYHPMVWLERETYELMCHNDIKTWCASVVASANCGFSVDVYQISNELDQTLLALQEHLDKPEWNLDLIAYLLASAQEYCPADVPGGASHDEPPFLLALGEHPPKHIQVYESQIAVHEVKLLNSIKEHVEKTGWLQSPRSMLDRLIWNVIQRSDQLRLIYTKAVYNEIRRYFGNVLDMSHLWCIPETLWGREYAYSEYTMYRRALYSESPSVGAIDQGPEFSSGLYCSKAEWTELQVRKAGKVEEIHTRRELIYKMLCDVETTFFGD